MLAHHIKFMLRNLVRERLYAAINIFGLTLGLACSIILALYINNEMSYDRHHENGKRLYRLVNEYHLNGTVTSLATSSVALGPLLKLDNPEVIESYTRFRRANSVENTLEKTVFRHEADTFYWDDVYFADINVFGVFDHEIIYGNQESALLDPYSIAISQSFARTYFGKENPVGKLLSTDTSEYTVNLVFADLPSNSHLKYDVLFSMNRINPFSNDLSPTQLMTTFGTSSVFTYILTSEGFGPDAVELALDRIYPNYIKPGADELGLEFDVRFQAQPLHDVHFELGWGEDLPTGNILYIYGFIAVAIFILLIACINYVNLATARSFRHAKAVGIRKVLGAERRQLVLQFLVESLLFVAIALFIAMMMVGILVEFNLLDRLVGKAISATGFFQAPQLLWLVGLWLIMGTLSGLYPAFYLSSLAPIAAISNSSATSRNRGDRFRQLLVLVQFTISIAVISITLIIVNQMQFVASKPLGFEKENKMLVPLRGADVIESFTALNNELTSNPNVLGASISQQIPGDQVDVTGWYLEDRSGVTTSRMVSNMFIGKEFLEVMGISIIEGRGFPEGELVGSSMPVLVNQTLVNEMGWEQPLGMPIGNSQRPDVGVVVGVTEDFHFESLYKPVLPLLMIAPPLDFSRASAAGRAQVTMTLVLNIASVDQFETVDFVRNVMSRFDPEHPFEFEFLDNRLNSLYQSDSNVMRLTILFSAICIVISCLGLFGLASYTTEQRRKEIGIRRVLGATELQIITLLFRNVLPLVLISTMISSILSFAVINQWLNGFAYRVAIDPAVFPLAGTIALVIAFITTAIQTARAVRENPIDALKYE